MLLRSPRFAVRARPLGATRRTPSTACAIAALAALAALAPATACHDGPTGDATPIASGPARTNASADAPAAASPSRAAGGAVQSGAPFDVGEVIRRVHFAFRPDGDAFVGGDATYATRATGGAVRFTPVTWRGARGAVEGAAATIETASIAREARGAAGGSAATPAGAWRAARPAAPRTADLELARGAGATEHLANRPGGLEQSWSFGARPAGGGDLVARVHVRGVAYVGETASGVHFGAAAPAAPAVPARAARPAPDPLPGVRIGDAAWVDARGARVPLRARFVGGDVVEVRVPSAVVDAAAYPAVLDPTISAEEGIDAVAHGPLATDTGTPAIAFGGGHYLVAWQDYRGADADIWGARVLPDMTIVDPVGLPISTAVGVQSTPAIASDGTNFIVVWADQRNVAVTGTDIYATRVAGADGSLLDGAATTGGVALSSALGPQEAPAVAYDGSARYLVAWQDYRTNTSYDVYATRVVAASGAALDATGIAISTAADDQTFPAVASDGTDFFVVWQDRRTVTNDDVYGARVVSATGALTDAPSDTGGIPILTNPQNQQRPSVAYAGGDYLVAWQDYRTIDFDVYAARVRASDGSLLDGTAASGGFAVSNVAASYQTTPSVATDGTGFVVAWQDARGGGSALYAARVGADGVLADGPSNGGGVPIATGLGVAPLPRVAADAATSYVVAWQSRTDGPLQVLGARLHDGVLVDGPAASSGVVVGGAGNAEQNAAIATDGTNYLVVWQDFRAGDWDVYGARVRGSDRVVLDANGFAISTAAGDQTRPAAAFAGGNYLVAWEDARLGGGDIFGTRIDAATATLLDGASDTGGIHVATSSGTETTPAIGTSGTDFLVAWSDSRSDVGDVYAARVAGADGAVSGTAPDGGAPTGDIAVSTASGAQTAPAVAFANGKYVVVWQDARSDVGDVYAARVAPADGALVDGPSASGGIVVCSATGLQQTPAIASNGSRVLVAWADRRSATDDVFGTRIDDATLKDGDPATGGIAISTATRAQNTPAIDYDGVNFVVAWTDRRGTSADVYLARVAPADGTLLDGPAATGGTVVSADPEDERAPRLASHAPATSLVVYDRFELDPPFGTQRIRARSVAYGVLGAACSGAGDCASSNCVDGVCCNTPCGGGLATDCQACSTAAGAAVDGTCGPVAAATVCRAASGVCDKADACDGTSTACPADAVLTSSTTCRPSAGTCDVAEACDGTNKACPADAFAPTTVVCRAASGDCDVAETCTGAAAACPADGVAAASHVCRASKGGCDPAESCDGTSKACPPDALAAAGSVCRAATACESAGQCVDGQTACPASAPAPNGTTCPGGQCTAGVCIGPDGGVVAPPDAGTATGADGGPIVGPGERDAASADDASFGADGAASGADGGIGNGGNGAGCGCDVPGVPLDAAPIRGVLAAMAIAVARRRTGARARRDGSTPRAP